MCSAHSVEEGNHNEESKQLNFIKHACRTAITTVKHILGELSHPPTISAKVPLLTVSSAKLKFRRRRPRLSFIKHQDCSVSQQINLVMNHVNPLLSQLTGFKAVGRLRSWSGCELSHNIYMNVIKY